MDIQALLGHSTINTTQIYANVGQERMEKVVAGCEGRNWVHGKRQDLTFLAFLFKAEIKYA